MSVKSNKLIESVVLTGLGTTPVLYDPKHKENRGYWICLFCKKTEGALNPPIHDQNCYVNTGILPDHPNTKIGLVYVIGNQEEPFEGSPLMRNHTITGETVESIKQLARDKFEHSQGVSCRIA